MKLFKHTGKKGRWRNVVAYFAVFAVILAGLTMAQPRQARAICETPASSIATLGLWLADSLGFLGDFGGAISDFLIADVETGQDEVDTRIDEFDFNTREGISEWWNEEALPALRDMSADLSLGKINNSRMRGSILDADAQEERESDIQEIHVDSLEDSTPSDRACQADTIMGGGSSSTNAAATSGNNRPGSCSVPGQNIGNNQIFNRFTNSCANGTETKGYYECCNGNVNRVITQNCGQPANATPQCTTAPTTDDDDVAGMTYAVDITDDISKAIAEEAMRRAVAYEGTPEALGMAAVIGEKWENMDKYCEQASNSGSLPCGGPSNPELINKEMQIGSSFLWGDRMTMDLNDEDYMELVMDAERAFVDQTPASAIPADLLTIPAATKQFNMTRSTAARKQAVHAVMASLIASRASRPESKPLPEVQEIRMQAGVPQENTTDKPSLHETTQALFQDRYTNPEFAATIVGKPEELYKDALDIQSGYLMQWNMMYKNMEKLAVLQASEFAQDLEDSEPDFVAMRGSDPYDGSINVPVDDPDNAIQECEIIEFEIPDNPFGGPCDFDGGVGSPPTGLPPNCTLGGLITPVSYVRISSPFGPRNISVQGASRYHKGVDFAAPSGTPIKAAADGQVTVKGWLRGYGNAIYIRHCQGVETRYAHLSAFAPGIAQGVSVAQGQHIGNVGNTGISGGAHLHFEVRVNGVAIDPVGQLPDLAANQTNNPNPGDASGPGGANACADFDLSSLDGLNVCNWPTGASTGQISQNLLAFLVAHEGKSNTPYWDHKGYSICYGHLMTPQERATFPNPASDAFCAQLLNQDLQRFSAHVASRTSHCPNMTQNQFDALVTFSYNLGSLRGSVGTAVANCNFGLAAQNMLKYVYASGQVNQGLVKRRTQEAALMMLNVQMPASCSAPP